MEAIRRLVREVGPTVPVLGFAAAPLDAGELHGRGKDEGGVRDRQKLMYAEPRVFRELLGRIAQATIAYCRRRFAPALQPCSCLIHGAASEFAGYLDFALPAVQEIVSGLDKAFLSFTHESINHLLLRAADSGADVLSVTGASICAKHA